MKRVGLALIIIIAISIVSVALAQSGGGYDLTWKTIDSGGATFSSGGPYSLGGTIGQLDAGVMSGGSYTLVGGFWGGIAGGYTTYLPLVMKNA